MKTTKKALSVLLAVIMIMTSMSVCFGTFSFTASAADDSKIEAFANALKNSTDVLAQVYNKDFGSYGNTAATGSAGKTNDIVNTTTLTVNTYAQYETLKNLVALFHEAIMASEEIGKTGSGDAATRTCTSGTHMYTEFEKKLPKYGCTMTEPVVYFLKLVLDDSKARQHDNYEEKKKPLIGKPSSSTTPANHTNTLIIKAKDEAYKGYLDSIGAYTNVESTIDLGVKYIFAMTRGYYTSKSGFTTYYRFHNYVSSTPAAPVYNQNKNTEAKGKVDAHATVINNFTSVDFNGLLAKVNDGTIDTFLSDFNSAVSTMETYVGGASTYNKLFGSFATAVAKQKASIQSAKSMQEYLPIVNNYKAFIAANPSYGVFTWGNGGGANNWGAFGEKGSATHAKMVADYNTFKGYYNALVAGGTVLDYFVNNGDIDMNYLYNFTDNYKVYELNDSRNAADNFYNTYKDTYKDYTTEEQSSLYSEISGYINAIGTYRSNARGGELQVINAIYNEGYVYLLNLQEDLKCEINEYVLYFAENAYKSFVDLSTQDLYKKIEEVKEKKNGLEAFYNTLTYSRRDQLLGQLRTDASNMLEGLYKTLADRFTAQVNAADAVYEGMERPEALNMVTFLNLSPVIIALEDGWDKNYHPENYDDNNDNNYNRGDNNNFGIQDYLDWEGKGSLVTSETRNKWSKFISDIYEKWVLYRTTYGFADYTQSQMTYEDRDVYEADEVKTSKYTVTEQNLLNTIADLDTIITSDTVSNLLGSLLNEDGAPLNIGVMLSDLVKGFLFKDDFINLVVQLLYPLVLGEFTKVFADLPPKASGMNVTYNKDFHKVCQETGLELYPDLLAGVIDGSKYPEAKAMLQKAGGYDDSWTSIEILDTETGKLKLKWGIDEIEDLEERETAFYNAFAAAAEGLKPLLMALIANQSWEPSGVLEFAHAAVLNVTLTLGATGNSGYANTLVPIYELLDVPFTAVSTIEKSTNVAYILEQILAPIFTFIEELAEKPVDTILGILPNLVYALSFGMVKPLLNKLYTQVWYKAGVVSGGAITVTSGGVDIYIGDTIITPKEDALLPESMFAGGINSLLAHFGLNLPAIDATKLATLGKLEKVSTARKAPIYSGVASGTAYTITADKADVAYYLLSYILGLVQDEAAFTSLLGIFMTQKDENGQPIKVDDKTVPDTEAIEALTATLYDDEGLNLDEIDVGDAIAAIVELANQIEYGVDPYYWYAGENNSPIGTTAAADIYLNPNNDWTEAKAEYLYNNLEALLNSIFTMAGLDISVEGALADALGGLFSNKTVTGLAKLLGSLSDLGALLAPKAEEDAPEASAPETVAEGEEAGLDIASILTDLLKNELGIDLSVYAQYANIGEEEVVDFGVTDAASFVAALTELLKPLKPVLDFILGGKDLTLIDSAITLHGYKGYDNAIIPLLEALGAAPAAYTEGADTLALTLNALVGVINKITTNDPAVEKDGAIYTIIDMLPGVIYYLSSNGLSQGIDKLLTPVYAILDTIRPIYNLDLAKMIKAIEVDFDKDGVKEPLGLDIKNLNWSFILGLLKDLLGLDLSALQQVIYDVCDDIATTYTSASKLNSAWKKGAYNANFSQADMLTVLLSFILEWATVKENAEKLDELLNTNGIIASLNTVFASVEIEYGTPNWMYWFESEEAFNAYIASGEGLPNTLYALEYPNDWTEAKAQYIAGELPALVDMIIGLVNKDKEDAPATLKALLNKLIAENINADTLNDLIGMIAGLLEDVDNNLLELAGYILGDSSTDKKEIDIVGLKNYRCDKEITTLSGFINELANVLDTYASGLVNWLFFGDDFRFAKKSDNTDTIVINGGLGYEKGLALILEALGCELPTEVNTKSVLGALATRIDAILANPVDEVLGLLPNLIYALNANALGVAVNNLLQPVNALLDKLSAFGLEISIADLIKFELNGEEITLNLANLSLTNVVEILKKALPGFNFAVVEDYLVNFCTGKIEKGTYIYKMTAPKEDVVTIILTIALLFVKNETNAAKLDEMLNINIISTLDEVFKSTPVEYLYPDYNYFNGEINVDEGTIEVIENAITYPNDWTEEKAKYLADNLPALVDTIIKMIAINGVKYDSLEELLNTLLAEANVFSAKTLNDLIALITKLLANVDDKLLKYGALLNVDLVGLKAYTAPETVDTVEEFADELANILNTYAKGIVEWLLLGDDIKLGVSDVDAKGTKLEGEDIITINGAHGYAEGLALILEALGCKNLPAVYDVENLDTETTVKAVLTSLANRINDILSNDVDEDGKVTKTIVDKILELLPNLIYFLNANGVATSVNNLAGAFNALALKLKSFGLNITLDDLVNLKTLMKLEGTDAKISLQNLTIADILEAVSLMTGLDLTVLKDVLTGFALGEVKAYESVSSLGYTAKMEFTEAKDKHDMITVLVTAVLLAVVENEDNAAKLDEMLGTDIVSALKDVFASAEIEYVAPNWNYPLADNGTVDAMKYSIEYPNNWTEETAKYVTEFLLSEDFDKLISGLIEDGKYKSLSELLTAKVNVFTTDNLQAIVDLIADLLKDIDDGLLEAAGVLLGADVVGLKAYKAPEGITTVDAFAAELANVLNTYAKGVVEWLLLGNDYTFFVKEVDENGLPVDFITLNGAQGYAEGLALLLEALGCKNLPAVYGATATTEEIVTGVLASLAARINEIFADPVNEIVDLLPNLFYFLNTNGVAAVVDNTLAALTALLEKLSVFGLNVNINELVNLKKLMKIEDTDATISLDNLSMADLLQAVSYMIKDLDITHIKEILVGFALGKVEAYTSVSKEVGETKKMVYATEFDKHDMVTVVANILLITIADEDNAAFVKDLVGDDIYTVITNLLDMEEVPVQDFSWQYTDKADSGYVFSALNTSEKYKSFEYGPNYTKEMAQYIADNFGEFVDNVIYLLGLEINGKNVKNLKDIINGLLDGNLYTRDNVVAIRDALVGVLSGVSELEVKGQNVGKYIVEVLKKAEIADIAAVEKVEIGEINNKKDFVEALCDVVEPFHPVLKWLLADDDISFFVDLEKKDLINLKGAEGYAYGIIPLLEALECEGILTPDAYYAAVEADADALLKKILDPLLNRVDAIIANPADEILAILPNIIYFVNSNGLDTVVKNTLNAVYALLNAIKPVAQINVYELIGVDLATIDFNWLLEKVIELIAGSGYQLKAEDFNALAELTTGTLKSYTSLNGKTAYKMVYAMSEEGVALTADTVTVLLRAIITFILTENNRAVIIDILKNELGMSADVEKYITALLNGFADVVVGKEGEDLRLGMDTVLATIYYIFYSLDKGVDGTVAGKDNLSALWEAKIKELNKNSPSENTQVGDLITDIFDILFNDPDEEGNFPVGGGNDVADKEEIAPNGFIAFFQRIAKFFEEIGEFFRNLFSFGK